MWKRYSVPTLIVLVIFGLIGVIFNGMADDIKSTQAQIEILKKEKVDNDTLKLLIEQQSKMLEMQQKSIDDKFNMQQKSIEQTLKVLQNKNVDNIGE
jgi:predicted PurR-regulated permease PerM